MGLGLGMVLRPRCRLAEVGALSVAGDGAGIGAGMWLGLEPRLGAVLVAGVGTEGLPGTVANLVLGLISDLEFALGLTADMSSTLSP